MLENLTKYRMIIDDSPDGECSAIVAIESKDGKYLKVEEAMKLFSTNLQQL